MKKLNIKDAPTSLNHMEFPVFLLTHPYYRELSLVAKMLFALIRERTMHNLMSDDYSEYIDENGDIFTTFPYQEMVQLINKGRHSITKAKKELRAFDLIETQKKGSALERIYINGYIDEAVHYRENENF